MSFRTYLENHYAAACDKQREIFRDDEMIVMLRNGPQDTALVKSWMRDYGLFQGITGPNRDVIVECFLRFARSHSRQTKIDDGLIKELYAELLTELFRQLPRSWMSATSKLLWCLYPESIVIYDSFVHRALVVMQCIDSDLSGFPRIGTAPTIKRETDIAHATKHYMTTKP
jgi:hypothetical protein